MHRRMWAGGLLTVAAALALVPSAISQSEVDPSPVTAWSEPSTEPTLVTPPPAVSTEASQETSRVALPEVRPEQSRAPQSDTANQEEQLITFRDAVTLEAAAEQLGVSVDAVLSLDERTVVVRGAVEPQTDRNVVAVESSAIYQALARPSDPYFGNQVGVSNIAATDAWDIETGQPNVRIAVVDSGVNGLHEDLYGKVIEGYDFVNDRPIARNSDSDDNAHGTAVASVAAAQGNNTLGLAGMSWNAEVMPVKVLNAFGFGYTREVVLGVRYAIERGANIIVMSIGSSENSPLLEQAINDAWDQGILVVAAAGNNGPADVYYPAKYDRVLAVGATNGNDVRAGFSNVGLALDLMAPGVDITHATDTESGYAVSSGTSFAAPFVAGTAALIKSRHPGMSPSELTDAIRNSTDKVAGMGGAGRTDFYGYGRLNAARALRSVAGNYKASLVSRTENIPPLGSTQSWQVEFVYRNTGTSIWRNSGPYRMELGTANDTDHIMPFTREDLVTRQPSGWLTANRIQMVESEVKPGATGTFRFWISVPQGMQANTYTEHVQLNVRDVGPVANTTSNFAVRVLGELDRYHAQYVGQTPNPTLASLASGRFQVFFKNVGNATWTKSTVRLGTSRDQDRVSRFLREDTTNRNASGWVNATRVQLDQDTVAPGQTGSFTFYLADTADIASGTYREYFQPVVEGLGWMEDHGVFWDVTVQ